jgi:hypothetical protein
MMFGAWMRGGIRLMSKNPAAVVTFTFLFIFACHIYFRPMFVFALFVFSDSFPVFFLAVVH